VRRPALVMALLGAAAVLVRKRSKAQQAERNLWTEATTAPDLR
jgi:hypothetical protein